LLPLAASAESEMVRAKGGTSWLVSRWCRCGHGANHRSWRRLPCLPPRPLLPPPDIACVELARTRSLAMDAAPVARASPPPQVPRQSDALYPSGRQRLPPR
jgi:hypothetical protein